MAIIKCKMCGGDIALNEEKTFGTCEYCGSTMTLPKVSDDQRAARFNRGNHFRRQGEFDKALAVYESIVREDDADAEAHWCCALCRFGIEYVEDPNTFEYLPTCHRASFDSFLEDVDYKAALENSDGITRRQYQKDAAKIAEVQRGILATSQNEEPFDVFICYKETDDETKARTRDSIDAQEIYYQLTQEGYRVFFSRITLEDKAGTEYEPYIFAALNSAKVMVAIGSKPEYFNAVWVKNEWSRFLAMMRKDRSKLLLPCYKGMDPYDLPEQLGVLQSYDMAKIGFVQDLIRGIKKVLHQESSGNSVKENAVSSSTTATEGPNVNALLKRGRFALEDSDWDKAAQYFDQALNIDAEAAEAHLGLALATFKLKSAELLEGIKSKKVIQSFEQDGNYLRFLRFTTPEVSNRITSFLEKAMQKIMEKEEFDSFMLGKFVQKNNGTPEPIEWKVIAKESDKRLVVCKNAIDYQILDTISPWASWDSSTLRKWLNDSFFHTAFTAAEQAVIVNVSIGSDENSKPIHSESSTADRVFLLSVTEVKQYYGSDEARKCMLTDYASSKRHGSSDGDASCRWWLRSRGVGITNMLCVRDDGSVDTLGLNCSRDAAGVRPAMWISIES